MQPSASGVESWSAIASCRWRAVIRDGLFEAFVEADGRSPATCSTASGFTKAATSVKSIDPYRFGPVLTDFDLHLFARERTTARGRSSEATATTIGGLTGVHFAVWAPNAQRVSVIGDFNRLGRPRPPDAEAGAGRRLGNLHSRICATAPATSSRYARSGGHLLHKTDPYGRYFEMPPNTASVVFDERYSWRDNDWMRDRAVIRRLARAPDVDLRGASRLVAACSRRGQPVPDLSRAGRDARALRAGHGLHAHRADARDGASVRRARGATRSSASSRRRAALVRPTTSATSSTNAIGTASA